MAHTFDLDRNLAYDRILLLVANHAASKPPAIITDIRALSPFSAADSAALEAWTLLQKGISHLKDGGIGGAPGLMSAALAKASLRNSSLAASLGVKPPAFEQMPHRVTYTTGYEEALFHATRLIDAARGDMAKSKQIIHHKIHTEDPAAAFGHMTGLNDPALKKIFDGMKDEHRLRQLSEGDPEDVVAVRRQLVMSFNCLTESYEDACKTLVQEISALPPPPRPPSKGGHNLSL